MIQGYLQREFGLLPVVVFQTSLNPLVDQTLSLPRSTLYLPWPDARYALISVKILSQQPAVQITITQHLHHLHFYRDAQRVAYRLVQNRFHYAVLPAV